MARSGARKSCAMEYTKVSNCALLSSSSAVRRPTSVSNSQRALHTLVLGVAQGIVLDFPRGNVADVALDDLLVAGFVEIADKLDLDAAPVLGEQRQILVADKAGRLERQEGGPARGCILVQPEFEQLFADKFLVSVAEELHQIRVHIDDFARRRIHDEDAVARRLEETAVTKLGGGEGDVSHGTDFSRDGNFRTQAYPIRCFAPIG